MNFLLRTSVRFPIALLNGITPELPNQINSLVNFQQKTFQALFSGATNHQSLFTGATNHQSLFTGATNHQSVFTGATNHQSLIPGATNHQSFSQKSSEISRCPLIIRSSAHSLSNSSGLFSNLPFPKVVNQQTRAYKMKLYPKRRCKGCYFLRRHGRLFVECDLKPRHKQMEFKTKDELWKEDYSKGNVRVAAFWKWSKESWYNRGKNKWSRFDWLQGKHDS